MYDIKEATLEIEMSGSNSTGYNFNSEVSWGVEGVDDFGFDFNPLYSYDLTEQWKKHINNL